MNPKGHTPCSYNSTGSDKYDHRDAGTEDWEQETDAYQSTEADKELEETNTDVPFPGEDALGPEGI